MIERILVPTDFSEAALTAVRTAGVVASQFDAAVVLVHVFDPAHLIQSARPASSRETLDDLVDRFRARALERLEETRGELPDGVEVTTTVLDHGSAAHAIAEHAAEIGAGLIVMSTHGERGFARHLLGSVTEKTVRLARCPVLTVPLDSD